MPSELVKNPKELLKLLDGDLSSQGVAWAEMGKFTRTEVRTLLANAKDQNLNLDYQLFKRLKDVKDKQDRRYKDALLAFYRKSNLVIKFDMDIMNILKGDLDVEIVEYLIDNQEWPLLAELLLRLIWDKGWKQFFDNNKLVSKLLKHALDCHQKNSNSLNDVKRCLRIIRENIYHLLKMYEESPASINAFYSHYAEIFGQNTWCIIFLNSDRVQEVFPVIGKNPIIDSCLVPDSDKEVFEKIKKDLESDENMTELFPHLDRILAASLFREASRERKKMLLAIQPQDVNKKTMAREFFDNLFTDVFIYRKTLHTDWLIDLDLSEELKNDPQAIIAQINQLLDWEYFESVASLLTPLSPELAAQVIEGFDQNSWDVINEFKSESTPLLNKIRDILLQLPQEQFAKTFKNGTVDMPKALYTEEHMIPLFAKFPDFFEKHETYNILVIKIYDLKEKEYVDKLKLDNNYRINETFIPCHQRMIRKFITEPKLFIDMLNTDFILAYRYFEVMTDEQLNTLYETANFNELSLCENLIDLIGEKSIGKIKLMLDKRIAMLDGKYLEWPTLPWKSCNLFIKLINCGEPALMQSIVNVLDPERLGAIFNEFFNVKSTVDQNLTATFFKWFVQSADFILPLLIKAMGESPASYLKDMQAQQLNDLAIELFEDKPERGIAFMQWLQKVDISEQEIIILLMNDKLLDLLLSSKYETYGADLYHISPITFFKYHLTFYNQINRKLKLNPQLVTGCFEKYEKIQPCAPPPIYNPSEVVEHKSSENQQQHPDLVQELAQMKKLLVQISEAVVNKPSEKNGEGSAAVQSKDETDKIIQNLCNNIINKIKEINVLKNKNEMLSQRVLLFFDPNKVKPTQQKTEQTQQKETPIKRPRSFSI